MSEPSVEADPGTGAAEATATPETQPATTEAPKPTETVDFWKQKAREQESRAKSNAEAARRLQELEDAQKSEAERLADRQAQIERERDEARADGLRYKAAARHGISEDYFDLLGAGDEETIGGRAERIGGLVKLATENEQLKAELAALRQGKPSNGRPTEALRSGAIPTTPTDVAEDAYPADFLPRRMRERMSGSSD